MIIEFDTAAMRNAAKTFSQLSEEYTTVYERLLNTASTMGEAWASADNLAYVEQINGFCAELQGMSEHLLQASQSLDQQAKNYEDTRSNNITAAKRLEN